MSCKFPHLLSPLKIRNFVLKNRMECADSLPHFLQGPESYPAQGVIMHYANKAKGGAAIVTCKGINTFRRKHRTPIDANYTHWPDFDLYDPPSQNYLMQLADVIHFHGAIACMSIHLGVTAEYPIYNPIDGSVATIDGHRAPEEYSQEELELIADSYAHQCKTLKALGFDMAAIHMCYRENLPSKMLSPLCNHRTDQYGGCFENRARFPLMVIRRIRQAVGENFLLEAVISAEEPEGGYTLDQCVEFLKLTEKDLDIVQLRAPSKDPAHPTGFCPEETPFAWYGEYMKEHGVKLLVATIGGNHYFDTCDRIIADGKADIVSAARAWISNPDYGKLAVEGRMDDLVPCIRCNKCHGRGRHDPLVSVCSVNPTIGIEHYLDALATPPGPSKRVAVVGGGPAGMKCAMHLCDRGHKVTLFEASSDLGGAIRHADFVDFKWPLQHLRTYLVRQVTKRDIEIRRNTFATPELIRSEGFDVVIAALGARPAIPPIPGIDGPQVCTAVESMIDPGGLGERVVVIGGGEVGVEAGINLARKGHHVTVLEQQDTLAADTTLIHYRAMFQEAWEALSTFHYILGATCTAITDTAVNYRDNDGVIHAVEADSVVISAGMKPYAEEAMAFFNSADRFYMIGDCTTPATIQQAMRSAYAVAHRI